MGETFDTFIVLAEMRTGSNFLESNLNAFPNLACHGEAFNPHFVGYPNRDAHLGFSLAQRERDPLALLDTIRTAGPGLNGFRFFHDHDPRVLDHCLADPRCAKIILTRNPVESYVSWKIANATGQWKLTDARHVRTSKIKFDRAEFEDHLAALQSFQIRLLNTLQRTGQTAFYLDYEDLQDVDVMNGLARWLGETEALGSLDKKLKKQNPSPLSDKVVNYDEMADALARLDRFNLARTPNFEPRRGPAVPTYVAATAVPLLYMPLKSGPEEAVETWLAALGGGGEDALQRGFTQKSLRQWKRKTPGHRGFTVLRHPVARAHEAFCRRILSVDPGSYIEIRQTLRNSYRMALPQGNPGKGYDRRQHRTLFLEFLAFIKANLSGQTSIRVDAAWASQATVVQGMGQFALPDMILREDSLCEALPHLAQSIGVASPPAYVPAAPIGPVPLQDFYDEEVEAAARDAYQRDYVAFGFGEWRG